VPRVPGEALEYLMYLLREVKFEGTLLNNPYTGSMGLDGARFEDRLRSLPGLDFKRQGDLIDFGWRYANLGAWADANLGAAGQGAGQGADGGAGTLRAGGAR
jgi:hypothetical protein